MSQKGFADGFPDISFSLVFFISFVDLNFFLLDPDSAFQIISDLDLACQIILGQAGSGSCIFLSRILL